MSSEISLDDAYAEESTEVETETTEVVESKEEAVEETTETEEVKAEETTEETEEETTESTTDSKKDDWTLTAVMDEREKRQAAVKRAEAAEAKLAELDKPADDVSVFDDETGSKEQERQKNQADLNDAMLSMSRAYAVRELGEEAVAAAETWYATEGLKSPYAMDRVNNSDLKFHEAVDLMKEDQARQDPETYKAQLKAEIMAELKAETVEETPKEPITPSLASKRSAGGNKPTSEDFEDILGA